MWYYRVVACELFFRDHVGKNRRGERFGDRSNLELRVRVERRDAGSMSVCCHLLTTIRRDKSDCDSREAPGVDARLDDVTDDALRRDGLRRGEAWRQR